MKLIAITRVKNEIDIVEAFVRHHVRHFTKMLVVDDGSTDGTYEVLRSLQAAGLPIVVMREPVIGYYQSESMTRLLHVAVDRFGADWVAPLDVDEFIETPEGTTLADVLAPLEPAVQSLYWNNFAWRPQADEGTELNPVVRMQERVPTREPHEKVLVPARVVAGLDTKLVQGSHLVQLDGRFLPAQRLASVNLCHYPIRSPAQYAGKVAIGYLQYLAMPNWTGTAGFQYIEPFRLLCSDFEALSLEMAEHLRFYSLEQAPEGTSDVPQIAPLRYLGGPLRFTPNREVLLSNVLRHAEAMAKRLAEVQGVASKLEREEIPKVRARCEDAEARAEAAEARATKAEFRLAAVKARKSRVQARAAKTEKWARAVTRSRTWRVIASFERLFGGKALSYKKTRDRSGRQTRRKN